MLTMFLYQNGYAYNNFDDLLINYLNYLLILIICTWDKFYYIIKNKGNDSECYFNSKIQNECIIHKSYTCGCCRIKLDKEKIEKYINFYIFCSKIVVISNGKIKFIGKKSKNTMKFVI